MMIHTYIRKSKKRKLTAKQRELKAEWEEIVKKHEVKKVLKSSTKTLADVYKLSVPPGRETPNYPSLNSGLGSCTKPIQGKVYTGTAMKGIGTLHKSNAVPIFTDEEAKDQAAMRR
jgi:hypothetical protein